MKLYAAFLTGLVRFILLFVGSLKVTGHENLPERGPFIVVINHLSSADPPLIYVALRRETLSFLAAEKWGNHLLYGPLLGWAGAIYVNRGEVDRVALRASLDALEQGRVLCLAPEGTRSATGQLMRARDGAAYLAAKARLPIVPVAVVGTDLIGGNLKRLRRTRLEVRIGEGFELPSDPRPMRGALRAAYTHLIMIKIAALLPARYYGYFADSPALKAELNGEDPWPACLIAEGAATE